MPKFKAPENAGTGCSIGGRWFEVIDGVLSIPDDDGGDYGAALGSLGYVGLPHDHSAPSEGAAADGSGSEAGSDTEVAADEPEGEADGASSEAAGEQPEAIAGEETEALDAAAVAPAESDEAAEAIVAPKASKLKKG